VNRARLRNQKGAIDKKLFFLTLGLVFIGLVAVADASAPQAINIFNDKFHFVKEQLVWAGLGIAVLLFTLQINYKFWQKIASPVYVVSVLLLVAVLIPGIGIKILGARRWISVGPVFFQPSEVVKFGLIIYMAKLISTKKPSSIFFIPVLLVAGLIMLEPDLGTTIVVVVAAVAQIFFSDVDFFRFIGACFAGILGVAALILGSSYRRDRLLTFLQTTQDPLGKSYHIRQVLLALGSGGLLGVGLGQSRQKYLFLPEAATDSIFAVIAEEIGFIGALVIIIAFIFFILRAIRIVKYSPDKFAQVLSLGLTVWIGSQILLNLGSMVAAVPLTGIPLPFISYGGSSLVTVLFATGILLNISKHICYEKPAK